MQNSKKFNVAAMKNGAKLIRNTLPPGVPLDNLSAGKSSFMDIETTKR